MAVTIGDLLNLEIMRDFKVIAGEKGLCRTVSATEILDFEFIQEGEAYREKSFEGNSLVLSSLLFAKDNPELILQSVRKLVSQNVQALAYKPVFFRELPEEALAYANEKNFPILQFGRDEFFEDIIFGIRSLVEKDDIILKTESILGEMLSREFSEEDAVLAREEMNPLLLPAGVVLCAEIAGIAGEQITDYIRRGRPDEKLRSKTFLGKWGNRMFMVLSQDEINEKKFRAQFDDLLLAYGLLGKEMILGVSAVRNLSDHFDEMVRQAYWSEKMAKIQQKDVILCKNLGIYQIIVSNMHTNSMTAYMENYLAPLFGEEEKDGELLHTAVEYILAGGDTIETAQKLYCHKNTIRYRIGKLQEKLDANSSEKEFYQNLAAAIQIYLLLNEK